MEKLVIQIDDFLDSDMSPSEAYATLQYLMLWARFECEPSDKQIARYIHPKLRQTAKNRASEWSSDMQARISNTISKRGYSKNKMASLRKKKEDVTGNNLVTCENVTDQYKYKYKYENKNKYSKQENDDLKAVNYITANFTLQNCRTKASILTFISKMDKSQEFKEKLRISVLGACKDVEFDFYAIHELIDNFSYKTREEENIDTIRGFAERELFQTGDYIDMESTEPAIQIETRGKHWRDMPGM